MGRSITIQVSEQMHEEIVRRAGGGRKITKFVVPLIQAALDANAGEDRDSAGIVVQMMEEIGRIKERLDRLEASQGR